ncbi:hypothetical protein BJ138DRAFT_1140844 [Hygrophoropsis aurantiaca]|uniref:Uncharacterized protein n=1 Tax=Hygrophoropsis aurantiaca TaxID=72124 RepID=A0ACB8ASN0_9AGAM|nr:hypothetical protein BJ138DRAFT_1140844 [Hygrophoropsis aurantiaca]
MAMSQQDCNVTTNTTSDIPLDSESVGYVSISPSSDPDDLKFHQVPAQILDLRASGDERRRVVFRLWPRDPKGKMIPPSALRARGKMASNGLDLWGGTLYDFFHVYRMPGDLHTRTTTTSSQLVKHMRESGELDAAKSEISWADAEEDPQQLFPCDIGELFKDMDRRVLLGFHDGDSMRPASKKVTGDMAEGHKNGSKRSIFDLSNYPPPWPLLPNVAACPRLQARIPLHLLPRKLIVHDPWKLLSVHHADTDFNTSWLKKEDVTRTYRLQFSPQGKEQAEQSLRNSIKENIEIQQKWDKGERDRLIFYETASAGLEAGAIKGPVVRASLPKRPQKPLNVPEAHLYITPNTKLGEGHHSVVYRAELELPRWLFYEDKICERCVVEQAQPFMRREMSKASDLNDEASPRINLEADVTTDEHTSAEPGHRPVLNFTPDIKYEHNFTCKHGDERRPVPQTARMQVAAKFSIERDSHLEREANNYQAFPSHLSEHWNGYNIVPPIHEPVPIGAVVPQFYGYYFPDAIPTTTDSKGKTPNRSVIDSEGDTDVQDPKKVPYLSPLLLLEHCGQPLVPQEFDITDRQECASLLFRFHHAGWIHGSFAERKILVQAGPLMDWPMVRWGRHTPSFRLIDFGRSIPTSSTAGREVKPGRAEEENAGLRLCSLYHQEQVSGNDEESGIGEEDQE